MNLGRAFGLGAIVFLSGCGGGLAGTGIYCIEIDPPIHNFGCDGGSVDVTVSNFCGTPVSLSEPSVGAACVGIEVSESSEQTLEDGDSATYTVTYTPDGAEAWDCTVVFPHDLAGEPAPEIPLDGGGDGCI